MSKLAIICPQDKAMLAAAEIRRSVRSVGRGRFLCMNGHPFPNNSIGSLSCIIPETAVFFNHVSVNKSAPPGGGADTLSGFRAEEPA